MKKNKTKQIKVISNTHWDREFRWSFEKTRRRLLDMMDNAVDILEKDPSFHSFTLDGHAILLDDYLEMRPEMRPRVEKLVQDGRLIAGPWYTLAEEFSISHEALVRNFVYGRKTVESYGGKPGTVAYTPSSWGQTGQLPQILRSFGIDKMMFYRGVSHHETDAEYIWAGADGTKVLATRFAIYARYNWYYQVHRPVTRGRVFDKSVIWGEFDDVPCRFIDGLSDAGAHFNLLDPEMRYDKTALRQAIEDMVEREGPHFTTDIFLAMNGHDISVPYPLEPQIIRDAQKIFKGKYSIEHTDLEGYWQALEKKIDKENLAVLAGERRAVLQKGMWTHLFPCTISARVYLKQMDFAASNNLSYSAEPLSAMACLCGAATPQSYLDRAWRYLLGNHTHDANGGCAPDAVCLDMEYRYRKTSDIADIVIEDAISHIAKNLSPGKQAKEGVQILVFNPLPFERDIVTTLDLEYPALQESKYVSIHSLDGTEVKTQPVLSRKSNVYVDNIWEVPSILDTTQIQLHAEFRKIPALGYRAFSVMPQKQLPASPETLITGPDTMENSRIKVKVNGNGTVDVTHKTTGKTYCGLNYLSDQGESGNAWMHKAPCFDRIYNSKSVRANIAVVESGPMVSRITAEFSFSVPADYTDGNSRNERLVELPIRIEYTLVRDSSNLLVAMTLDNVAKDHWLRAMFPTELATGVTHADSHFDIVERTIKLPDSTGWVEPAWGAHPLRTFVAMDDGKNCFALFPKGLFEYEAFDNEQRTLGLTLLRGCRIKLALSEEKQMEMPDQGIQCLGIRKFEYAISIQEGRFEDCGLASRAAEYFVPVRTVMCGRGKGTLPLENSFVAVNNDAVHITCIKPSDDGKGIVLRCYNTLRKKQEVKLTFGFKAQSVFECDMNETVGKALRAASCIQLSLAPKQIKTLKIILIGTADDRLTGVSFKCGQSA